MQKRRKFWLKCNRILLIALLLSFAVAGTLFARAGGAGGSSGGSSGGSGGGDGGFILYIIIWMFRTLGPVPSIIILVAVAVVSAIGKKNRDKSAGNALQNVPVRSSASASGERQFMNKNPGFNREQFTNKVRTAFFEIQHAWSTQNISAVRRYISDGVYQRFTTQFQMMKLLNQSNTLKNIRIHSIAFESFEEDSLFQVIHLGIHASMDDSFTSPDLPGLSSNGSEGFTEYWSFIRRGGYILNDQNEKDLYSTNNCPKCDATLPENMGERGNCPYCNALVNSGEYDWILSEITQADDYGAEKALRRRSSIHSKIARIASVFPDFSVQQVEDHTTNAFFQILSATTTKEPEKMRRFTSDSCYADIYTRFPSNGFVYHRLYTNYVTLIGAQELDEYIRIFVALRFTSRRIQRRSSRGSYKFLDPGMVTEDRVLVLKRKKSGQGSRGSVLMHQCASCGAPIASSTDTHCPYCTAAYNSGELEWVVDGFHSMAEYNIMRKNIEGRRVSINPALIENLYDVRQYALNNVVAMAGADGRLDESEKAFVEQAASSLRFSAGNLEKIWEQAASGRMSIRMPLDLSKRRKIIELMRSVAEADGTVSIEERQLLDQMELRYKQVEEASRLF